MYDIKELTYEKHRNAERQEFVKILMSGEIDEQLYATYLYNQLQCYSVLEKYGMHNSLFNQTPGLQRAEALHYDCLLYTSPSPRDQRGSRMPSSA